MTRKLFSIFLLLCLSICSSSAQYGVPSGGTNTLPVYFVSANETAIQNAATTVCANTPNGGQIIYPGGNITLTKPIKLCSGLILEGPPMWSAIPSGQTTCVGGACFQATISTIASGTYNSGTGVITLTTSASVGFGTGVTVALYGLTGTGAFANLNSSTYCARFGQDACNWVTIATTSGTTVTIQGPTGLGSATITGGSLTFDAIEYHNADLAAPLADGPTFLAGQITGCGVKNSTFVGFANGIKIGGKYNPGAGPTCEFSHLNFINNQLWNAWFENYNNSRFDTLYGTTGQIGCIARVGSGTTLYNGGNTTWIDTKCNTLAGGLARGLVTWVRGSTSNTTQDTYINEGPNGGANTLVSQAATMSNASCNITVTDATKFPMDMPMGFDASQNGFNTIASGGNNTTYFVVSNNGSTVITVSATMRGACITPSGNTAVNAVTKGYPIYEIAALDSSAGFIGMKSYALDVEGSATAQIILQNITSNYTLDTSVLGGDTYNAIVRRSATRGFVFSMNAIVVDGDTASANNQDVVYNGSNAVFKLLKGNGGGILLDPTGNFQWGIPYSGRWNFGDGSGNAFSSALDTIALSKQNQGYATIGSNANGNVLWDFSQGGANGGSNNGQGSVQCGLVGTATDADYKFNVANTSLLSGDFLCQTYTGAAFKKVWWNPGGDYKFVTPRPVVGATSGVTLVDGEQGFAKISPSSSAPGAGFLKIEAVAGTNANTCKIIAYAGTSATPVTIVDNVGSGC